VFTRKPALIAQIPNKATLPFYVSAAAVFEGNVRTAVISLKYRNQRQFARPLGKLVADAILYERAMNYDFDYVTWAPTTSQHLRERGMDHAELIAREVGKQLGIPVKNLLRRMTHETQTHRSRQQRLLGPTFRAHSLAAGRKVLVVDDVVTTGATLHAVRRAFRSIGVELVECWAVAATPSR
jgi:predicted amidophosphoribosyltransferase